MSQQKKIPLLVAMVLLLLGLLFALYWYGYARYFERTDNAYLQSEMTGIATKLPGYISEVLVTDNQTVKAGQLIARLDDREYRAQLAEAEANVALNRADAANLEANLIQQHSVIRQAEAKVNESRAEVVRARQQVSRIGRLNTAHYSSQDNLDEVRANLQVSQAQQQDAEAGVQAARDRLAVLTSERDQRQALIDLSLAQLAKAELNLSYTEIKAPADGVIGKRSLREGLYVQSGMQIASLVPLSGVWVEANFKETQLANMVPGQKVELILDAYPDQPVEGIIDSLSPATGAKFALLPPENATGNFTKIVQRVPVKIRIPAPGALTGKLLPGLSTEVIVDTRSTGDTESQLAAH
ncbi:HlyD family secretion protein [Aeromonas rivuli]|uniref:HlyD family secretion protein n=1 Tax=Aeromonas rivuli TaxID=648794 RepID=UPI0005AAD404|nr:HlyD family secretion protein [Aeromonas rivuli]UBO74259.1 HlyD family secretion protein [Aeromonas rivuli]